MAARRGTSTSNFGVGSRENHDASGFYERFQAPLLSDDTTIATPEPVADPFLCADARRMDQVADSSVALIVTSPPYFAGKQYEEELERDGVPSSYLEYLQMLADVFAECVKKLEPGGRIAVNVANLGRKPYRSLSSDVLQILEGDLGLLLRGELVWQKAEGASGSCAWGSFRSAANPVLRDVSERVIVASKGRFDRARTVKQRAAEGLPHESTIRTDDFLDATLDVWSMPPESAQRVGHPAPFPIELPEQLIELYTFKDDLVLDPFMGSGSTLVAAAKLDRRYIGYDTDPSYIDLAKERVMSSLARLSSATATVPVAPSKVGAATAPFAARAVGAVSIGGSHVDTAATDSAKSLRQKAADEGKSAKSLAAEALEACGFTVVGKDRRVRKSGITVGLLATDRSDVPWFFEVAGSHTANRGGLLQIDAVWRALGRAHALRGVAAATAEGMPTKVVLLTTALPRQRSEADRALRAAGSPAFFDAIDVLDETDISRLQWYAEGGHGDVALPGFWSEDDLDPLASQPDEQ